MNLDTQLYKEFSNPGTNAIPTAIGPKIIRMYAQIFWIKKMRYTQILKMERQTNSMTSATNFCIWNCILICHSLMGWINLSNPSLTSNQESSAFWLVLLMTSCFASSSALSLITASSNCCCFLNLWTLKSLTSDSMSLKMAIPGCAMASKGAWMRLTNPDQ